MHFVQYILTRVPDAYPQIFARLLDETRPWRLKLTCIPDNPKLNTLTDVHNHDLTSLSNGKAPASSGVLLEQVIVKEAVPNSLGFLTPQNSPQEGSVSVSPSLLFRKCYKSHFCRRGREKFAVSSQLGAENDFRS